MSEDMKMVLMKLDGISADLSEVKKDVAELKQDVIVLQEDVAVLKQGAAKMQKEITGLQQGLHSLKLIVENDLSKKINVIAEGHSFVWERLEDVSKRQKDRDRLALELIDLRTDMRQVKAAIGMA